jgi:hypothetical protein
VPIPYKDRLEKWENGKERGRRRELKGDMGAIRVLKNA